MRSGVAEMEYPASPAATKNISHLADHLSQQLAHQCLASLGSIPHRSIRYGLDQVTEVERHRVMKSADSNFLPHSRLVLSLEAWMQPGLAGLKQMVLSMDIEISKPADLERCASEDCHAHLMPPPQ